VNPPTGTGSAAKTFRNTEKETIIKIDVMRVRCLRKMEFKKFLFTG
jgi:hypothetical protein